MTTLRREGSHRSRGRFIVLEGIDGAGTSTQGRLLLDWMLGRGRHAALTSEPSGGPIGQRLRQVLSGRVVLRPPGGKTAAVPNEVVALLFAADRLDHLANEIEPLLAQGTVVISDRYYHSSLTYQALWSDLDWIRTLNARARTPDVTFLLDVPARTAARRRSSRCSREIYERDSIQRRLEHAYRRLPSLLPSESIVVLDGSRAVQQVHRAITQDLVRRFGWST